MTDKVDTSAEAVEGLARLAGSRAVLARAAASAADDDDDINRRDKLNRSALEHDSTAATLRALLAEREALAAGQVVRDAPPKPRTIPRDSRGWGDYGASHGHRPQAPEPAWLGAAHRSHGTQDEEPMMARNTPAPRARALLAERAKFILAQRLYDAQMALPREIETFLAKRGLLAQSANPKAPEA